MSIVQTLQHLGYLLDVDFDAYVASGEPVIKWLSNRPQPTTAEIEAARLPATKAARIAQINAECESRILAVWPLEKQVSALAGIYGAAQRTAMDALIAAHIDASNIASDAVTAATTVEAVEAVAVTWPV